MAEDRKKMLARERAAAMIAHLKQRMAKPPRTELSNENLAIELNKRCAENGLDPLFTHHRLSRFQHLGQQVSLDAERMLLKQIDIVSPKTDIVKLTATFREINRRREPADISSSELGFLDGSDSFVNYAPLLEGAWRVFYISPFNRKDESLQEVRSFVVFFRRSRETEMRMAVQAISKHTDWIGFSVLNGLHIYTWIMERRNTSEAALFTCGVPSRSHEFMSGLVLALSRSNWEKARPTIATLCVGQRVYPPVTSKGSAGTPLPRVVIDALADGYASFSRNEEMDDEQRDILRERCCNSYSTIDEFVKREPDLGGYAMSLKLNGKRGVRTPSLYLG